MKRRRQYAAWALGLYSATALLLPFAHQRWHQAHGADHVHQGGATYNRRDPAAWPASEPPEDTHATFDADLRVLELTEAAHAGVASVDCELSRFTLASCAASPPGGAALGFGDELLARQSHHHPTPADPAHGRGASEHLGSVLVSAGPYLLAPPAKPVAQVRHQVVLLRPHCTLRFTHSSRGPPPHSA